MCAINYSGIRSCSPGKAVSYRTVIGNNFVAPEKIVTVSLKFMHDDAAIFELVRRSQTGQFWRLKNRLVTVPLFKIETTVKRYYSTRPMTF